MPDASPTALLALSESGWRWLDAVGLALLVLFLVLGARRGLWWQVVRLLGLAAAIAIARAVAPRLAPGLSSAVPGLDARLASGIVWITVIALGLSVVALVGKVGKDSIEVAQLGLVDRVGGALAGGLSAVLVHGVLVLCLVLLGPEPWAVDSVRGTRSLQLLDTLGRRAGLLHDVHAAERLEPR